jgi:signal transduction histidine kinase
MKVRTKLGIAIGLPVMLLGAMLLMNVRTTRRAVAMAYELTAVWSQVHRTSVRQFERVSQLEELAAKFRVTGDRRYLGLLRESADAFEHDLHLLQSLPLGSDARMELLELTAAWDLFRPLSAQLSNRGGSTDATAGERELDRQYNLAVDRLARRTERVSQASLEVMVARLAQSRSAARRAERASLLVGIAALLLSATIAALVVQSIARPISRLAEGTLEVGRGRFDYRMSDDRHDEFARVAADFNRMAERLGEVDRLQRDFVSRLSHDLKTPLAAMQETSSVLLDGLAGPVTGAQRRLLSLHRENCGRLSRMLTQLLDLSHLEAMPEMVRGPIAVTGLVRTAVECATATDPALLPRFAVRLPDDIVILDGDPDRLRQLLDNLFDNALKYSPVDAPIQVDVRILRSRPRWIPEERWVDVRGRDTATDVLCLSVADRGLGIDDAEKERVFSRFHQTGRSNGTRSRGVGLGLTICREIARAHDGAIWVDDNPGGGTIVHVVLPGARLGGRHPVSASAAVAMVTS